MYSIDLTFSQALGLQKNGKLEDAEKLYREILKTEPRHANSNHNLGVLLTNNNKADDALILFKVAIEVNPNIEQFWISYINIFIDQKNFKEAEIISKKITNLKPNFYRVHFILGLILNDLGKLDEAEASYRKAIELKFDYAEAYYNLGIILISQERLKEAEASNRKAIQIKPDYSKAYYNLGLILKKQERLEEAEASNRKAIELKPDYAEAYNNLGTILQIEGKLKDAEVNYRKSITLKPDYAEAHVNLASIKKFETQDEQYLKMNEIYLNKNISKQQLCQINFALAKSCEDLEDFKQAFNHYREGNELRKNLLNYNISQDIKLFAQLKTNYDQIKKNSLNSKTFKNKIIPIFIVGMPRSGTTLIEQIISSHSGVTGAGELSFVSELGGAIAQGLSKPNIDALLDFRDKYLIKLNNYSNGNQIVIDKMPQNFRFIGLLASTFPEAKIIHVKRNPAAVCWANYKTNFLSNKIGYCNDLDNIIEYYRLYKNLMEFWENQLPNRIYDVDYEFITVNQENETKRLINYLSLNWEDKCLFPQDNTRRVTTASNIQIRKKIYQGSSLQWKKYKPFLNGALDYLDSLIKI